MKAYKGFEKQADGSLKCRDFTYEEGKTYEMPEKEIELCKKGFHACKELHQCWLFYPHKDESVVYHEVEFDGKIIESDEGDGKVCCSKITIGKEIDTSRLLMVDWCSWFHEGYAVVREGGQYTFINTEGEFLIKDEGERWFDGCDVFYNGYGKVKEGRKYTYVDTNGNYLIKDENERWFDGCWDFENGYGKVRKGEKWTYIDARGEYIINDEGKRWFDWCCDFQNGYAMVEKGGKYTYVDANGNYLIKDESKRWFDDCYDFKNGYARVREGGKYTYINTEGEYLIKDEGERWFAWCGDFNNGIADVKLDNGEWKKLNANDKLMKKETILKRFFSKTKGLIHNALQAIKI